MLAFTVTLIAGAAAATQLAAPGFQLVNIDPKMGEFYSDHFAQQLTLRGLRVTTRNEIAAVLGLERQKALMGCEEAARSCLAELAGAIGADGIITGSLAKLDSGSYVMNVKIVSGGDARPLGAWAGKAKDQDGVVDWLTDTAERAAGEVSRSLGRETASPPTAPTSIGARSLTWVATAVGGAALVAGIILFVLGKSHESSLRAGQPTYGDPALLQSAVRSASGQQTAGLVVGAIGLAALAVGVSLKVLGTPRETVAVTVAFTGTGLAVAGAFP